MKFSNVNEEPLFSAVRLFVNSSIKFKGFYSEIVQAVDSLLILKALKLSQAHRLCFDSEQLLIYGARVRIRTHKKKMLMIFKGGDGAMFSGGH